MIGILNNVKNWSENIYFCGIQLKKINFELLELHFFNNDLYFIQNV